MQLIVGTSARLPRLRSVLLLACILVLITPVHSIQLAVAAKSKAKWGFMRNIINIETFFKDPNKAKED
jgi:hypothetical protein